MLALDAAGLVLPGEAPLPLWSGALHYFRTPPAAWQRAIQAAAGLGLPIIESYVPWGIHEVGRGHYRFTGQYDLGRFLDLCADAGRRVILRPGPHINAELPWFGFPERLVHDPRLCMRGAGGQPMWVVLPPRGFPAPSYAAARLYEETTRWYQAVAEVVAPRLYPKGPVVALQVDNEQPLFFRTGAYDGDYHEEALAAWEAWQRAAGWDPAPAPRTPPSGEDPLALAPHLRWLAFREQQVPRALGRLAGLLGDAGLGGVPLLHNFPPADPVAFDVAQTEAVLACAGIDMYHARGEYERVRRRALYLQGTSRYPYVPEMGAGSFPWGPPLRDEDGQQTLLCALSGGVRGFNLYMLVERDRWYGSPLSETGEVRPRAEFYRRVLAGLRAAGAAEGSGLVPDAPIGVLLPREYLRLGMLASRLCPLSPMVLAWLGWDADAAPRGDRFGLSVPVQRDFAARREALLQALARLGRRHVLVDASAPDEVLARRRALVVPTYEFLDRGLAQRLHRFVLGGGTLLIGPHLPRRDEDLAPCAHAIVEEGHERVRLLPPPAQDDGGEDLAALAAALQAALPPPDEREAAFQPEGAATVHVSTHRDAAGVVRLVGVGHGGTAPVTARLALPAAATLRDLVSGEAVRGEAGVEVPLPPCATRLFLVE